MKRAFAIDVFRCNHCGGRRKLIAQITDGVVVRKILAHLGLPSEAPILARTRLGEDLDFDADIPGMPGERTLLRARGGSASA